MCLAVGFVFPPAAVVGGIALEVSEGLLVAGVAVAVAIDHPTQDNWVMVGGDALALAGGYVVGKVLVGPALGALGRKLAQREAQQLAAAAEEEAAAKAAADKLAAERAAARAARREATQARWAARAKARQQARQAKALDNDGGHSYADHGAQTTEAQQVNRLRTGTTPSGRTPTYSKGAKKGQPQIPSDASKFDSHAKHLEAAQKAEVELQDNKTNPDGSLKNTVVVKVPVQNAGTSYSLDGTGATLSQPANAAKAVYRLDPATNTYKLVTMYPEP